MSAIMHAIRQQAFGGPEVLELAEVQRPAPLPTEVLVRVRAVGVNRPARPRQAPGRPSAAPRCSLHKTFQLVLCRFVTAGLPGEPDSGIGSVSLAPAAELQEARRASSAPSRLSRERSSRSCRLQPGHPQ
jgi:hypothetical protein